MAHLEPMDVDDMAEDKENAFGQNIQPLTEKGYEERDGSEVNMRLRYSMTPQASPMSKSYTVNCPEKKHDENLPSNENPSMVRSLNSTVSRDTLRALPLQVLHSETTDDPNQTAAVLRQIDSVISDGADVTVNVTSDHDEASIPSSSSSPACTPEAVTPTKEIPKPQGSPIMRGLKSVLNIFRTSQSPIPPDENELPNENLNTTNNNLLSNDNAQAVIASTPLVVHKEKDSHAKPATQKESIAFKDNLQKQLLWNDDEVIIFTKKEKVPIHKLFLPLAQPTDTLSTDVSMSEVKTADKTLEAMDISYNDSVVKANESAVPTTVNIENEVSEKDESVFLDCESTLNETELLEGTLPVTENVNITQDNIKTADNVNTTVNASLNDTNFSMKSAETLLDAVETSHASIDSVQMKPTIVEEIAKSNISLDSQMINNEPTENNTFNIGNTVSLDHSQSSVKEVSEAIQNSTQDIVAQSPIEVADYIIQNVKNITVDIDNVEDTEKSTINTEDDVPFTRENIQDNSVIDSVIEKTLGTVKQLPNEITNENDELQSDNLIRDKMVEENNQINIDVEDNINKTADNSPIEVVHENSHQNEKIVVEANIVKENEIFDDKADKINETINLNIDQYEKPTKSVETSENILDKSADKTQAEEVDNLESNFVPTLDSSMVSSVNITDDGVVLETANNRTIEVPNTAEDITLVDPDILIPSEDNEDELNKYINNTQDLLENKPEIISDLKLANKLYEASTAAEMSEEPKNEIIEELVKDSPQEKQEEEIFVSESNSPYVSLKPDDNAEIPIEETLRTMTSSPPICSKGYTFNFDEIDDPFATHTKIRLSQSPESNKTVDFNKTVELNQTFEPIKKELQEEKENMELANDVKTIEEEVVNEAINVDVLKPAFEESNIDVTAVSKQGTLEESSPANENTSDCPTKENVLSSEQSTYFSMASSIEPEAKMTIPVFDEDMDPFSTKSKIRLSPPPSESVIEAINKALCQETPSMVEETPIEKDLSRDVSLASDSSKVTDEKNDTVIDAHTEDEDTMEGPFIEAGLSNDNPLVDLQSEIDEFKDLPPQADEESPDAGEMFIDAEAFEFLMNQNRSNEVALNGKESLFLKFDPLFSKRVNSDGVLEALTKIQKRQSTPKKMNLKEMRQFDIAAGPSNSRLETKISEETFDDNSMSVPNKPTMVVPPAMNIPKNQPTTPTRQNRRSVAFSSPAMTVIDRLLCMSAHNSPAAVDNTFLLQAEREEASRALVELRELLAEKELNVSHLNSESNELKDRLATLESQMKTLEEEGEKRLKNINELEARLSEKDKKNKSMEVVVEEYERTIAGLISEMEQDRKQRAEERSQLIKDRDEQSAHLASMEVAFSDLHSKYEKSKQIIYSYKAKEDEYRKSVQEFEENLLKMQNNYELLKQHATAKLNHANVELEKINKAHEGEVIKYNAMIKRKDMHITSLEETLAQKTKANEELTAICDELINKVG